MTLMYVTACASSGRNASVLIDAERITMIRPFVDSPPEPFFDGSDGPSRRTRDHDFLRLSIVGSVSDLTVPVSEWPRIKAVLTRLNGGGFNRFGNDAEDLERPRVLTEAPSVGHTSCPDGYSLSEYADVVETRPETARGTSIATFRSTPHLTTVGVDTGTMECSPSS